MERSWRGDREVTEQGRLERREVPPSGGALARTESEDGEKQTSNVMTTLQHTCGYAWWHQRSQWRTEFGLVDMDTLKTDGV